MDANSHFLYRLPVLLIEFQFESFAVLPIEFLWKRLLSRPDRNVAACCDPGRGGLPMFHRERFYGTVRCPRRDGDVYAVRPRRSRFRRAM